MSFVIGRHGQVQQVGRERVPRTHQGRGGDPQGAAQEAPEDVPGSGEEVQRLVEESRQRTVISRHINFSSHYHLNAFLRGRDPKEKLFRNIYC